MDGLMRSWFGDLILFGATWALIYHMFGRLRHVIWDFGYCLDVEKSEKMAKIMFGGATVLAILVALVV